MGPRGAEPLSSVPDLVGPLLKQTWVHLDQGTPEGVLPRLVARGDRETRGRAPDSMVSASSISVSSLHDWRIGGFLEKLVLFR